MSWYSELTNKLAHWLGRSKFDDSLDEELRSHMDMRADELVAAGGLSRQQADAQTRREFGSPLHLAEQSRAAWRWGAWKIWAGICSTPPGVLGAIAASL